MHTQVNIIEKGDPAPCSDYAGKTVHELKVDRFCVLQGGMQSGKASVAIMAEMPDGSVVFIETSADMFESLAAAMRGARKRWGEIP